ncbi:citrate synthase, partial [Obba rivulosa]
MRARAQPYGPSEAKAEQLWLVQRNTPRSGLQVPVDPIARGTPHPEGKILTIGGGIANFTNIAATFKGIIRALKEYKAPLIARNVRIYARRGAAMIYPFGGHHIQKSYWGTKETLLPVYTSVEEATKKHPDADVVNFASSRSVSSSTLGILRFPQIRSIALISEGAPERRAREILHLAKSKDVLTIGPATVGGIKPGCFRIGNSGGMMDNIIASKLYRPGSVGCAPKSGDMSNELNNILSLVTNGTYESSAIGGDRYPGSTLIDHLLRYEADPECKMLVLLGEVGGIEEYCAIEAAKQELFYADMRISDVFKGDIGLGGTVSLPWFKRRLPPWATKFIEMVLMLTADHGPAVSGAMNTIVATRAGKGLISSLASGLTIGSRFGGALDAAAAMFSNARDMGLTPREFVNTCRRQNKLSKSRLSGSAVNGIGHKIKSVNNPDLRVELVKEYVRKHFPSHSLLDYALAVEKAAASKKDTLIQNVNGCNAACFVDLLRGS